MFSNHIIIKTELYFFISNEHRKHSHKDVLILLIIFTNVLCEIKRGSFKKKLSIQVLNVQFLIKIDNSIIGQLYYTKLIKIPNCQN
jgi:hypothetical protein